MGRGNGICAPVRANFGGKSETGGHLSREHFSASIASTSISAISASSGRTTSISYVSVSLNSYLEMVATSAPDASCTV